MRKRVKIALAVLLAVIAGLAVWQGLREREPVHQRKRLSVWLQGYVTGGSIIDVLPDPGVDKAVRQIGTNGIPTLLHLLRAHNSKMRLTLYRLYNEKDFIRHYLYNKELMMNYIAPACIPTEEAATAFHALGATASNAVPRLIQTYRDNLGSDSQCACVEALGWIGPAASGAIPDLLSAATNSDNRLRAAAVEALGRIRADPGLVLPVLTKSLQDSNVRVRLYAVRSLAGFGSQAKPAVSVLTQSLNDPVPAIRTNATNALQAIAPEAAARAGVK